MDKRLTLIVALIASAAAMRLLPHPPNFAPITALALFAGAHLSDRFLAFSVPLAAMVLSDVALQILFGIGWHSTLPAVYASFVAVVCIGLWVQPRRRPGPVAAAAAASSLLFFVVTNFAVWADGLLYPRTAAGLVECYAAAIPFYGWTAAGDLFYTAVMFGLFAVMEKRLPAAAAALGRA